MLCKCVQIAMKFMMSLNIQAEAQEKSFEYQEIQENMSTRLTTLDDEVLTQGRELKRQEKKDEEHDQLLEINEKKDAEQD